MSQLISSPQPRQSSPSGSERQECQLLGFTIGEDFNALIPLIDLQATIEISLAEILPVPQMKESLLGIINYGGKATWVIDLAQLMDGVNFTERSHERRSAMGLLFQYHNETIALLVRKVNMIETYDLAQCMPIGDAMFPERMKKFLSGYFIDKQQQPWIVIDLQRTIQSII